MVCVFVFVFILFLFQIFRLRINKFQEHEDYTCKNAYMKCEVCLESVKRCDMLAHVQMERADHPYKIMYFDTPSRNNVGDLEVVDPPIQRLACADGDEPFSMNLSFQYTGTQTIVIRKDRDSSSELLGVMFLRADRADEFFNDSDDSIDTLTVSASFSSGIKFFEGKEKLTIRIRVFVRFASTENSEDVGMFDDGGPPFISSDMIIDSSLKGFIKDGRMGVHDLLGLYKITRREDFLNNPLPFIHIRAARTFLVQW